jgi:hypothetical protein
MTTNIYGPRRYPFNSRSRFVALFDILGMKNWLACDTPESIASAVDEVIGNQYAAQASSALKLANGQFSRQYGPLVGMTHFSDTVLAWTYDDSWASLSVLCRALRTLLAVACHRKIPLRGALAVGEIVCDAQRLRFVGPPLAEAYQWSEGKDHRCPYRGIGISFTPGAVGWLRERAAEVSMPGLCLEDFEAKTFADAVSSQMIQWHDGICLVNHWVGMRQQEEIASIFERRLPTEPKALEAVMFKQEQTVEFWRACVAFRPMEPAETSDAGIEEVCRLSREGRRVEAQEALERDAVRRRAQQDAERRAFEEEMGRLELLRLEDSVPLDLGYRIEKT